MALITKCQGLHILASFIVLSWHHHQPELHLQTFKNIKVPTLHATPAPPCRRSW